MNPLLRDGSNRNLVPRQVRELYPELVVPTVHHSSKVDEGPACVHRMHFPSMLKRLKVLPAFVK
jgi:hypothetical protein